MSELLLYPDSRADYDEAVERWLAEADPRKARDQYRQHVFPLACERVRRADLEQPDLLFVPVGTQPYAPALAVCAWPARCVALLETPESAAFGEELAQAWREPDVHFLHVRVEATDLDDIATKMRAVYESRGLPGDVVADITGGRKTMTAAVAGMASLLGWRLTYVEGVQVRERDGLTHHERILELPNLLELTGERRRERALSLLAAGATRAAERELSQLVSASGASRRDRDLLAVARAARALREGNFKSLARTLKPAARALGEEAGLPPEEALEQFAAYVRQAEGEPSRERAARPPGCAALDRWLGRGLARRLENWR